MTFMNWLLTARTSDNSVALEPVSSLFSAESSLLIPLREVLRALLLSENSGPNGEKLPMSSPDRSRTHCAAFDRALDIASADCCALLNTASSWLKMSSICSLMERSVPRAS